MIFVIIIVTVTVTVTVSVAVRGSRSGYPLGKSFLYAGENPIFPTFSEMVVKSLLYAGKILV